MTATPLTTHSQGINAGDHHAFGRHLTFQGNLKDTRYGWLRLTPAYSLHLVDELLDGVRDGGRVLDPFCGTGTTAVVCGQRGIESVTTDINPFLIWLTDVKAADYTDADLTVFDQRSDEVIAAIETKSSAKPEWLPALHQIDKWWDEPTLHALGRAMATIKGTDTHGARDPAGDLLRIVFCRVSIERAAVSFGHQSMSFKKRREQEELFPADDLVGLVRTTWKAAAQSVRSAAATTRVPITPRAVLCDARELTPAISRESIAGVITSPPYPNRMSYIRELRPYLYWLGYLADARQAGDLDWQAIGGTWGSATSLVGKWEPTDDRVIAYDSFLDIIAKIAAAHETNGPLLSRYVHKYFFDMVAHIEQLNAVMEPGVMAHYIVGNSKFYDVLLPVQDIYAAMFEAAGFDHVKVRAFRKRSSKKELFEYVVEARRAP